MPVQRSMADFTGHFRGVPKSVPMPSLRFAVIELRNFLLTQDLGEGDGFSATRLRNFASTEETRRIGKCLRVVYLQTRGEVAERLKAAVC